MKYGDKAKRIRFLKVQNPTWSYREIAKVVNCSVSAVYYALTQTARYNPNAFIEPKYSETERLQTEHLEAIKNETEHCPHPHNKGDNFKDYKDCRGYWDCNNKWVDLGVS